MAKSKKKKGNLIRRNTNKKIKRKLSKKCFKVYNPYHEALVYEYLGKNREKKMKNLDKNWKKFSKQVKKKYNCIKFYEGLIKDGGKKMIEYKI